MTIATFSGNMRAKWAIAAAILAAAAMTAQLAEARTQGLRFEPPFVRLPTLPGGPTSIDTVRTDAAGDVFALTGPRVATFRADGTPIATWQTPGATSPFEHVVADVSPDGLLYATLFDGDTIAAYDRTGALVHSWGGLDGVLALAVDPRGGVLVADRDTLGSSLEGPKRFSPDGEAVGPAPGGVVGLPFAVAAGGTRWAVTGDAVYGRRADGRPLTSLGRDCRFRHIDPHNCPSGPGGTNGVLDIAGGPHGGFAAAQTVYGRLSVFDGRGRPRISCRAPHVRRPIASLDYDPQGGGLVVAEGLSLRRARYTATPGRLCDWLPLAIRDVKTRRAPGHPGRRLISYRLTAPARVWIELLHARGVDLVPDRFDRVPGARGRHTVRVPTRRGGVFQLVAVGRRVDGFNSPYLPIAKR